MVKYHKFNKETMETQPSEIPEADLRNRNQKTSTKEVCITVSLEKEENDPSALLSWAVTQNN